MGTTMKLRVWLPLGQVMVAIALATSNYLRPDPLSSPSWRAPDWQICGGLNAPATLIMIFVRNGVYKIFLNDAMLASVVEGAVYLALIALLWYFVAVEISSGNHERLSTLAPKMVTRTVGDVLLICFGLAIGVAGVLIGHEPTGTHERMYWASISVFYFVWAFVLIVFYGRDLWIFISSSRPTSA